MKFSMRKLHVGISKVKPSRKRKRSANHEVVTMKTRTKMIEEMMKSITPMTHVLAALTMASLFKVIRVSSEAKIKVDDQSTEIGLGLEVEARVGDQLVEEEPSSL